MDVRVENWAIIQTKKKKYGDVYGQSVRSWPNHASGWRYENELQSAACQHKHGDRIMSKCCSTVTNPFAKL